MEYESQMTKLQYSFVVFNAAFTEMIFFHERIQFLLV